MNVCGNKVAGAMGSVVVAVLELVDFAAGAEVTPVALADDFEVFAIFGAVADVVVEVTGLVTGCVAIFGAVADVVVEVTGLVTGCVAIFGAVAGVDVFGTGAAGPGCTRSGACC
jgi:hypothetical protein